MKSDWMVMMEALAVMMMEVRGGMAMITGVVDGKSMTVLFWEIDGQLVLLEVEFTHIMGTVSSCCIVLQTG